MAFDLKQALAGISSRYTDAERAEQERLNKLGRNLLDQNLYQNRIANAHSNELAVRGNIEAIEQMPEGKAKETRLSMARERLAELFAQEGQYAAAIALSGDEKRRKVYQLIEKAVNEDDDKRCDCPIETIVDRKAGITIRQSTMQTVEKVVSLRHKRVVTLKLCRKCGFANAA
jgi:hypothetical protein